MNWKSTIALAAAAVSIPLGALAVTVETAAPGEKAEIAVLLPGKAHDNGFMEAGYRGYERIAAEVTPCVVCVSDVSAVSDRAALTAELEKLASQGPRLIIGHGGQMNGPVSTVSKAYPQIQFAVIQGNVTGTNVSSYTVNQEQSAFLAGALAGYMTRTGKVGHISGAWPKPGLQARAAFYHGLIYANPKAVLYSTFTGNLDDAAVNKEAAEAQIQAGCDVIYTMLNGGRSGVTEAAASTGGKVREIGNVIDWTKESPVFIGSAVADSSVALVHAAQDYQQGTWKAGTVKKIGLEDSSIVRLAISPDVPAEIQTKLMTLQKQIEDGTIVISTDYTGPEFDTKTGTFVSQDAKNHR